MIKIDYPQQQFRIRAENNIEFIFDGVRRSWLRLTPEEWVRQNFVQYLIQVKNYPASFLAIEKEIQLGELKKRFDILVYDKEHKPWMMIECKEMNVHLDEKVLQQVLLYNMAVPVRYMIITNGAFCAGFEKSGNRLEPLECLPVFP
jgi:hypothetical protein